ncbi:MAG: serine/threonine-protein kinase [Bryobacteraceae bacterium]|nr:serine/threonine-protein kinase [Bryobacteraceae bacterium]
MVTREGRVKILDFGLARQAQTTADDATRTLGGMVMGTVAYMSPEQARGQAADARSDIFSFGSTLYEMLAAKQPFTGDSAAQTMAAVIEKDPPPLPDTVSQGLKGIVLRCLEKEPSRRFQSASDLAYALRALSGSSTSVQPSLPVKRTFPWLTAALAVALAGTLAFFLLRPSPVAIAISDLPRTPIPIEEPSPGEPAFSPDGKSILYPAQVGETRQVFLRQLDSPDPQQLTKGAVDVRRPAWSPDASKFYFIRGRELCEQPVSGSTPRVVLPELADYAITPDGRGVVFVDRYDAAGYHLQISSPMGSPIRPLRNAPVALRPKAATNQPVMRFSPDGKQLMFAYGSTLPIAQLFVIPWPEESGAAREVPLRESSEERHRQTFAWLGDSRYVVAEHRVGGRYGLDFIDTRQATRKSHFSSYGRLEPSTFAPFMTACFTRRTGRIGEPGPTRWRTGNYRASMILR